MLFISKNDKNGYERLEKKLKLHNFGIFTHEHIIIYYLFILWVGLVNQYHGCFLKNPHKKVSKLALGKRDKGKEKMD